MADAQETFRIVKDNLRAGISTLYTGPPGVGKTAWTYDLQKEKINGKEVVVESMIASNRESTDIGGYPTVVQDPQYGSIVKFVPVDWAVRVNKLVEDGKFVIVFIDEYRDITPPVMAALNKVVHERRVGEFRMPFEVRFLAAANSIEDSTVGVALPAPTANRWAHIEWNMNSMVQNWLDGMILNKFALQAPLEGDALERLPQERALVASFIHKYQEMIHKMPKAEEEIDGPWPSPRTLDMTAHAWAAAGPGDVDHRMRLMAALVGHYTAAEFVKWQREMDLPDPEKVLDGTIKDIVAKNRPDITYATISSVVSCVSGKWTKERYINAWKCMDRVAKGGAADVATALVPVLEKTTDTRSDVPDIDKYIESLLPILLKAGVQLR